MAGPSNSLRGRLKDGIMEFCERMADVEAGRWDQYGGMPQQLRDADDERRRLRKKAQKAKEKEHQKSSNEDAVGDEHRKDKHVHWVDEPQKDKTATSDLGVHNDETTKRTDKLRKNKPVDKAAAHNIGKLQKKPQAHGKPALTSGKTVTGPEGGFQKISESSSDEELEWATDRMMLGDLDEVPVGPEHSKTETTNSSKATEEPPLRLRGGGRVPGSGYKFRDFDNISDQDYRNALRESARNTVNDRSWDKERNVRFAADMHADESRRYPSFRDNHRAGSSPQDGFGRDPRTPSFAGQSFRGERQNHDGSTGRHFDQSSGSSPQDGFGRDPRTPSFAGQSFRGERQNYDGSTGLHFDQFSSGKSTRKHGHGAGLGLSEGVGIGQSSSSKNDGGKPRRYTIVDSSDEGSDSGRSPHEKGKGGNRGGRRPRRPRSPSSSPRPTRTRTHGSSRHKSGRRTSKAAQDEESSSNSDERTSNRSDEESQGSSEFANAVNERPPDHYAVLGLTPECSAQEITEAAKRMRIKTHPDKLKKEDMSAEEKAKIDETAGNVGQAAEVLSDPEKEKRREYDRLVRKWEIRYGNQRW